MAQVRLVATVRGHVQGVGFRAWVGRRATALGVVAEARNAADGTVEVVAHGERDAVQALVDALRGAPERPGRVDAVEEVRSRPEEGLEGPTLQ